MAIYEKSFDGSFLGSVLNDINHNAERKYADTQAGYNIWANAIPKAVGTFFAMKDLYDDSLEKQLEEKQKEYDALVKGAQDYENSKYNPTTFDYQARNGTVANPDRSYMDSTDWMVHANPDNYFETSKFKPRDYSMSKKEQWLYDNPDKTEEDYENFLKYMNSIYGVYNAER